MQEIDLSEYNTVGFLETTNAISNNILKDHLNKISKSSYAENNKKGEYLILTIININDKTKGKGTIEVETHLKNQTTKINIKYFKQDFKQINELQEIINKEEEDLILENNCKEDSKKINKFEKLFPFKIEKIPKFIYKKPVVLFNRNNCENLSTTSKRGKYKMFSEIEKERYLEMIKYMDIKEIAAEYDVPLKNLKRWLKVGFNRKKGCGRKVRDPELELNLINWYKDKRINNKQVTVNKFMTKAKMLSNLSDFKASKGWLNKVRIKHNLYFDKLSLSSNINNII